MKSLTQKNTISKAHILWIVLPIIACIHLYGIWTVPEFYSDDFYTFGLIASHPDRVIPNLQSNQYSLNTRIVSYAFHWFEYTLIGANSLAMKVFHLILLMFSVVLLWKVICLLCNKLSIQLNHIFLVLVLILYGVHHGNAISVLWVMNVNETLMVNFYLGSVIMFLGALEQRTQIVKKLFLCLFFFILAVLTKQQSIHLPLLFGMFFILNNQFYNEKQNKRIIQSAIFAGIVIMIVIIYLNATLSEGDRFSILLQTIWKKPFSILGIFISMILPIHFREVYYFFLNSIVLSLICFIAITIALAVYFRKLNIKVSSIAFGISIVAIIFFPRIFEPGDNDRVNTIQLVWMCILLAIVSSKYIKNSRVAIPVLSLFVGLHVYGYFDKVLDLRQSISKQETMIDDLIATKAKSMRNVLVVLSPEVTNIPAWVYYRQHKKFGFDSTYTYLPVYYGVINQSSREQQSICIEHTIAGDTVSFKVVNQSVYIARKPSTDIMVIREKKSIRSFLVELQMRIDSSLRLNHSLLYFNGKNWEELQYSSTQQTCPK